MAMVIREAAELLPPKLAERPIFKKVTALLDFVVLTNHYDNVVEMVEQFQVQGDHYQPELLLGEFGAEEIKSIFTQVKQAISDSSLLALSRMVYNLKGTSRGLVFMLRMVGINATVYEGTRVQREIQLGTQQGMEWTFDAEISSLEGCKILLGIDAEIGAATDALTEAEILNLIREFSWVCSNVIGFKLGVSVNEKIDVDRVFEPEIHEDIRQPFGVGLMRDYPYPPFDIGGFFVGQGEPRPDPDPVLGRHHVIRPMNRKDGWYDLANSFEIEHGATNTVPVTTTFTYELQT